MIVLETKTTCVECGTEHPVIVSAASAEKLMRELKEIEETLNRYASRKPHVDNALVSDELPNGLGAT